MATQDELKLRLAEISEELEQLQEETADIPYSVYLSAREVADYEPDADVAPVVKEFVRRAKEVVNEYEYVGRRLAELEDEYDAICELLADREKQARNL